MPHGVLVRDEDVAARELAALRVPLHRLADPHAVRHGAEAGPALVERADGMLYLAKQAGRGRYRAEAGRAQEG